MLFIPNHAISEKASKKNAAIFFVLFYILTFAWLATLTQGLPASDIDDWDKIIMSQDISWSEFGKSFLTPWSQSLYWVGQSDRYDEVHYKRIVLPMLLKFSQQFFGPNPFAMYLLTKAVFFAGCVALVFWMLSHVVPWLYAVLGALIFLFVPAHYSHVLWIADTVTLCYFFLFLGIGIFYSIQKNILERGSNGKFQGLLLALFAAGWIGIRAKEPMLVLPLVVFLYSLVQFRRWRQAPMKFLAVNAAMALVAFQIIPVTHLSGGALPAIHFNFGTIGRLLFRNYDCGYDNEATSAFFSWAHVFPVSVARTLGFFALWAVIISLGLLGWRKWIRKETGMVRFWSHPLIQLSGIWFLAELPFLGMFQPDPRYFSGTMAPIIILIARLIYCAMTGSATWVRRVFFVVWMLALGFNVYENVQNTLSLRIMIGRRMNYFLESARIILQDLRGKKTDNDQDVGRFYCSLSSGDPEFKKIKDHIYYVGLDYDFGNKAIKGEISWDDFNSKARLGYCYYAAFEPPFVEELPRIRLVGTVDGMNRASLLERMMFSKKKKKRPAVLKLYKFDGFDAEFSAHVPK